MRATILVAVFASFATAQELSPKAAAYLKRCDEHT
jgi:hypothetical protein